MTPPTYVIEFDREREVWVLHPFGRHGMIATGPTVDSIRSQAFGILRNRAPRTLLILGDDFEEWRLEHQDGDWEQVEGPEEVNVK